MNAYKYKITHANGMYCIADPVCGVIFAEVKTFAEITPAIKHHESQLDTQIGEQWSEV